ncbi:hypothetical protein [Candidatus Poriferisodalis sp.]|uniref:hypothetical protein n=1 Tax=Candidatus Poriferisodalis sp. TaxID=3101277 RepID=UPI003B012821
MSGSPSVDHLAVAVENWARDMSHQIAPMRENSQHRRNAQLVFDDLMVALAHGFETLAAELAKYRTESLDT